MNKKVKRLKNGLVIWLLIKQNLFQLKSIMYKVVNYTHAIRFEVFLITRKLYIFKKHYKFSNSYIKQ